MIRRVEFRLRPPEPLPPYPYGEQEVAFAGSDVTLAATLTLPPGDAPPQEDAWIRS